MPASGNGSPTQGSDSGVTHDGSDFAANTVRNCENIIEDYRRKHISYNNAIYELVDTLGMDDTRTLSAREITSRNASLSVFTARLDEILAEWENVEREGVSLGKHRIGGDRQENANDDREGSDGEGNEEERHRDKRAVSGYKRRSGETEMDEESDEEEVRSRSKRRRPFQDSVDDEDGRHRIRVDPTQYPFYLPSLTTTTLDPILVETLRFKKIYTDDIRQAKQNAICHPNCPDIPQHLWNAILSNEFVDLDKILTGVHTTSADRGSTYRFGPLELVDAPSKPTRHVLTSGEWNAAWFRYDEAVRFAFPNRKYELRDYAELIYNLFTAAGREWELKVIDFDRAIRCVVGRRNNLLLTDTAQFNAMYTKYIVRPREETSRLSHPSQGSFSTEKPICFRWNNGQCTLRACRYRHVCVECGSTSHPSIRCTTTKEPSANITTAGSSSSKH